jgi:hypothetical protein
MSWILLLVGIGLGAIVAFFIFIALLAKGMSR